jgi:CheY-like chemotaxis protein
MARLLNALLDISRLESGAIEPQQSAVFVPDLFEDLRQEFDSIARARGLDLTFRPMPVTVKTDRVLFQQLLQNLLGNALKYTDVGSVTVECTVDAQGLTVAIIDTGIGIPPDKLERIFDEYYQVDTHGAKRLGVGLGLAIVKEVARLLNFRVKIASTVGRSTQACVSVPAELVSQGGGEFASVQAERSGANHASATRIFLVEDNDGVRMATELFLKLEGFEVRSAGTYADAVAFSSVFREGDIVVADYHLDSAHTGLAVLAQFRALCNFEVPGVILSGDLPSLVRTISTPVPAARFLSKPVDTDALLQAITDLTASSPARRSSRG